MLQLHKTPVVLLYFNQPVWILWLTSLLIFSSF